MKELVFSQNGKIFTDSLKVAEKFDKEHSDVLKTIRNLTRRNCRVRNLFVETEYINERNQSHPMYIMNRDGFTFLVMGFTGKDADNFKLDFIEAFSRMEQIIQGGIFSRVEIIEQNIKRRYLLAKELKDVNASINSLMKRHKEIEKELRNIDNQDFSQLQLFPRIEIQNLNISFPNKNN